PRRRWPRPRHWRRGSAARPTPTSGARSRARDRSSEVSLGMATAARLQDAIAPHSPHTRARRRPPREEDERVFLHGVSWAQYEAVLEMRGERSVPRLTYLEGTLELMSPSIDHEGIKTTIARLVEAYADEAGLPLNGYGSWTVKRARRKR